MTAKPTFLCLASYKKGDRFLIRAKQEGCKVFLLIVEKHLRADWPREHLDDVFALKSFDDLDEVVNAVGWLAKTRKFDRIIALDDGFISTEVNHRASIFSAVSNGTSAPS